MSVEAVAVAVVVAVEDVVVEFAEDGEVRVRDFMVS